MTATFIFLMIGLKIPIIALFLIVRWAIKQTPETAGDGDGGQPKLPRQPHPRAPIKPHPRRGPHGAPAPSAPPRVRSVTARGRELSES